MNDREFDERIKKLARAERFTVSPGTKKRLDSAIRRAAARRARRAQPFARAAAICAALILLTAIFAFRFISTRKTPDILTPAPETDAKSDLDFSISLDWVREGEDGNIYVAYTSRAPEGDWLLGMREAFWIAKDEARETGPLGLEDGIVSVIGGETHGCLVLKSDYRPAADEECTLTLRAVLVERLGDIVADSGGDERKSDARALIYKPGASAIARLALMPAISDTVKSGDAYLEALEQLGLGGKRLEAEASVTLSGAELDANEAKYISPGEREVSLGALRVVGGQVSHTGIFLDFEWSVEDAKWDGYARDFEFVLPDDAALAGRDFAISADEPGLDFTAIYYEPESEEGITRFHGYLSLGCALGEIPNSLSVKITVRDESGAALSTDTALFALKLDAFTDGTAWATKMGVYYHCIQDCSHMTKALVYDISECEARGQKKCPICWTERGK